MVSQSLKKALSIIECYIIKKYNENILHEIHNEMLQIVKAVNVPCGQNDHFSSYEEVQNILATLNEKESIRKNKGVYYTPKDLVRFILFNSIKLSYGKLSTENLGVMDLEYDTLSSFCSRKTIYDPTCGTGAFLLAALETKFDLLDSSNKKITKKIILETIASIRGNDLNPDSIAITKLRLLLCVLERYGVEKIAGIGKLFNKCFTMYDFVTTTPKLNKKFDIIVGNPPYVEDSKSDSQAKNKYGNIYANVLENAANCLSIGGALGFVIPLSYVSTPRMEKIRNVLYKKIPEQYILSYSDRPDCLFSSVHQKLCIVFGRNIDVERKIYTGNYRYWYREERLHLFNTTEVVINNYVENEYIPKLGTSLDTLIYKKINSNDISISYHLDKKGKPIYLNMRAAFWIKAFLSEHTGSEYKKFNCENKNYASFCMCLLNSSLFWWFWICISDCWHITGKELKGFKVPEINDFSQVNRLAMALEKKLEKTKLHVCTKQTEYEYKHKACVEEISKIDDYINCLYGLNDEESNYIKKFAYRYRVSGGLADGSN